MFACVQIDATYKTTADEKEEIPPGRGCIIKRPSISSFGDLQKMAHLSNDKQIITGLELPPLRSLNDFILDSARFQIPNIKDLDKWGNRVFNNLLYYQTNYFFTAVIIFISVGLIHPGKMIVGMLATSVILMVFIYMSTEGRAVHNFKKRYPGAGILFMLIGSCFLTYTLGSLLVFLVGILLPFSVIFVHASLRLRNLRNKLINKIEGVGIKRSPMGYFLEQLGMEPDLFD